MVHTKTMKIILFMIDSRFSASPKYGGQGVFFILGRKSCFRDKRQNIYRLRGQCLSPQTAPALGNNAVLPFQVSSHYEGCLIGGGESHYLPKPPRALRKFSEDFSKHIFSH